MMETRRKKKMKMKMKMKMEMMETSSKNVFLNDEIIMYEILSWLPPKSLFRFKLVSKQWLNLISLDPIFISSQSQRSSSHRLPPTFVYQREVSDDDFAPDGEDDVDVLKRRAEKLLFLSSSSKSPIDIIIPNPSLGYIITKNRTYKQLIASANGLFLGYYNHEYGDRMLYLTNPITKSFVSVPCPPVETEMSPLQSPGLAFDPSGDGEPLYVIVFPLLIADRLFRFMVYSSRIGEWRSSNASVLVEKGYLLNSKSVFIGARIYWRDKNSIIWFNFQEDSYGFIPNMCSLSPLSEIGDCNGKLSYTEITEDGNIEISVLNQHGKCGCQWIKMHSFKLKKILDENMETITRRCYGPMQLRKHSSSAILKEPYEAKPLSYEGGDVVFFWVKSAKNMGDTGIVFSYDIRTGKLQVFQKVEDSVMFHSYRSSLAPLPKYLFVS